MDAVADYLHMPRIAVYEVASFYSMLETEPCVVATVCPYAPISPACYGALMTLSPILKGNWG